jgi:hypothetical protein
MSPLMMLGCGTKHIGKAKAIGREIAVVAKLLYRKPETGNSYDALRPDAAAPSAAFQYRETLFA